MKQKIYFLILNYCTEEETKKCVQTIKELNSVEYEKAILIVDNKSNDKSFEKLKELYKDDESIVVIQTEYNIGFSKANNLGYRLIKEKNDATFVIVCNSDIEFRQKEFLELMLKEFEDSKFHLCSPDVYCENDLHKGWKGHQSPAYPWEAKEWFAKLNIQYNGLKLRYYQESTLLHCLWYFIGWSIMRIFEYFLHFLMKSKYKNYRVQRHENVPIHGSCIILSTKFINAEKKIFTPETQFYGEELLLYLKQKREKYISVYYPELHERIGTINIQRRKERCSICCDA